MSLKKDPAVIALIDAATAKATSTARKEALKQVKTELDNHISDATDKAVKAALKAVKTQVSELAKA